MAGRFLFQKLASGSGMSRLTSRLINHASASARATTPVTPLASAARYLNTFPCSHATAKTGWSTTGTPSSIINKNKSAFVDSVGGLKRNCSSGAFNKHVHDWKAKWADWEARFVAWMAPHYKKGGLSTMDVFVFWLCAFIYICCTPGPWSDPAPALGPSHSGNRGNKDPIPLHCSGCNCRTSSKD